jgi:hypothetical protein
MELANQNQVKNPLDDQILSNDQSMMNLKCLNNDYSIQLDSETIKYLTMKKKASLPLSNDDENEMRRKIISKFKIHFISYLYRTDLWQ